MRRPDADHLDRPWRVHAEASDFDLLDVWRFPVRARAEVPLEAFLDFFAESQARMQQGASPAALLFRLRAALGRLLGWDRPADEAAREGGEERSAGTTSPEGASGLPLVPVYRTPEETLFELENRTVHALLHLGRVRVDAAGDWSPQLAVYVRPRGGLGRVYMAVISPFRHGVVYPALMRAARRDWPVHARARGWPEGSVRAAD